VIRPEWRFPRISRLPELITPAVPINVPGREREPSRLLRTDRVEAKLFFGDVFGQVAEKPY
jgi:hypothetical protein